MGLVVYTKILSCKITSNPKSSEINHNYKRFSGKVVKSLECDLNPMLYLKSWVSSRYFNFLPQGKLTGWVR